MALYGKLRHLILAFIGFQQIGAEIVHGKGIYPFHKAVVGCLSQQMMECQVRFKLKALKGLAVAGNCF